MAGGVVIRVDGSHRKGMGHVFRMANLAAALKGASMGAVSMVCAPDAKTLQLLQERGFEVFMPHTKEKTSLLLHEVLERVQPRLLVQDILDTSMEYMRPLRDRVGHIVHFDDMGPGAGLADLTINALPCKYAAAAEAPRRLEGPAYLMLAPDFGRRRTPATVSPRCTSILVTLGGSDTYGYTVKVVEGLTAIAELEHIEVVAGPAFGHRLSLEAVAAADARVKLHFGVESMARTLERHELVLTGGGITLFEAAALGVPALALASEDFEMANIVWLSRQGACRILGLGEAVDKHDIKSQVRTLLDDQKGRRQMSLKGRHTVDGLGLERVLGLLQSLVKEAA